jgi:hypothetical protein
MEAKQPFSMANPGERRALAERIEQRARAMRRALLRRWIAAPISALRRRLEAASLDERTRYLAGATDHADLRRRMQAWDEAERRRSLWLLLP